MCFKMSVPRNKTTSSENIFVLLFPNRCISIENHYALIIMHLYNIGYVI